MTSICTDPCDSNDNNEKNNWRRYDQHLSFYIYIYIPRCRSSNAVVGWINKLTGCRRGREGPRWEFHPYKTDHAMAREHRERSSSSLTAIQSLLRLNLFTIGSFNELHFGPRRISLWVLPTQSTCGNHAGALCRATTGCEGEKITGVVYRPDPALTPAPPFLPPIANVFEPRPCSFFLQFVERKESSASKTRRDDPSKSKEILDD